MSEYYVQVYPFSGIGIYGGWYSSEITFVAKDQIPKDITYSPNQSVFKLIFRKKEGAIVSAWKSIQILKWGWELKNSSTIYLTNPMIYLQSGKSSYYKMDGSNSVPADNGFVPYETSNGSSIFFETESYAVENKNTTYYSNYMVKVNGSVQNYTLYFVGEVQATPKLFNTSSSTPAIIRVEDCGVLTKNDDLGGGVTYPHYLGSNIDYAFPEMSSGKFNYLTWFDGPTSNALDSYFSETEPKYVRIKGNGGYSNQRLEAFGNESAYTKYVKVGLIDGKYAILGEFESVSAAVENSLSSNSSGTLCFRCQAGGGAGGGNGWNIGWSAGAGGGGAGAFSVLHAVFKSGRYAVFSLGAKAGASADGTNGNGGSDIHIYIYEAKVMIAHYRIAGGGGGVKGGAFNNGGAGGTGGSAYVCPLTIGSTGIKMSSGEPTVYGDNPIPYTKRIFKNDLGEVCLVLADWIIGGNGGAGGNGASLGGSVGSDGKKYAHSSNNFRLSFVPNTNYYEYSETQGDQVGLGGAANGTFSGGGGGGLPWRGGKGGNGAKGGASYKPTDAAGYGAGGGGASGGIGTPVYGNGSGGGACMVEIYI